MKHHLKLPTGCKQQLATGKRENPGINAVRALADFFGVPIGYFADDTVTEEINAQLRAITRGCSSSPLRGAHG
ncbi:hypothetical protein [Amycolatopsis sp. CA-230715]|uniref:hypothetical protein n=1 Tax=Amycolatopsis sp. CA-230715 TaxID=2745196 RepID=UPI001C00D683|nr:hypothetical protein [Amycolatopsis sp. CA-230715]